MSIQTANTRFSFKLPTLSYIDASWEEPNLRAPAQTGQPVRKTGLAGWLGRQVAAFQTWRRNQQALAEISMMSDYELADIGLTRSDMHRVFDPEFNQDLRQRG
jgi:uncharacterized protein YjiS (DUF1127 family)